MTFTFVQLWQTGPIRHFAFQGDRGKAVSLDVTVDVDMELARKHRINTQELPLVCLRFLQSVSDPRSIPPLLAFTEDSMRLVQATAAASRPVPKASWKFGRNLR